MDNDDCKTWMLKRGECEELHCPHLLKLAATQEEPAERECTCKSVCPHDEPARDRFKWLRAMLIEEALTESWEELVGPLELLLAAPARGLWQLLQARGLGRVLPARGLGRVLYGNGRL